MKNVLTIMILFLGILSYGQCTQGDCENGVGTKTYSNGNKYQGSFKNGKRHGKGKFIWASGALYEGNWVEGKREGQGQEILANGTIYVGGFKNDLKDGKGVLYNNIRDQKIIKQGVWVNGTFQEDNDKATPSLKTQTPKTNSSNPKIINYGLGLGSFYGVDNYSFSDATSSSIPPISISIDFPSPKTKGLTFGGYFGYTSNKLTVHNDFFGDYGWKYSYYILGARATYSINLFNNEKTIPYGCVMLGYNVARSTYFGDDSFGNSYNAGTGGFTYSGSVGIRHMLKPKIGGYAELGYGIAYLTIGLSMRI